MGEVRWRPRRHLAEPPLAACDDKSDSPGTDPTPTGQAQEADQEYDLDGTGEAAAELLGGDGTAAYAVLKAFDSGYSPYQIAYAIDAGLIDGSGAIESVTPAWPSGNTLSGDGTRFILASIALGVSPPAVFADTGDGRASRSDFEQMFDEIRDEGESGRWLVWLLGATGAGYSAAQITQYLDENQPPADRSPPSMFGIPIIRDGEGNMVEPELPSDWPYEGRNTLLGLQEDEELGLEDNWAVLVIGMVNAGYSEEQITDAVRWNGIGLCTTQGGSSDGEAAFTPCYVDKRKEGDQVVAELVPPAETTPFSPAEIVIDDVIPNWPLTKAATQGSPNESSQLQSGEKVSLKLTPFLSDQSAETLDITSSTVVMEIEPATATTASLYSITGSWKMELLRTETDETVNRSYYKGDRHVLEGEFFTDEDPTSLDRLKLATTYTWTFKPADENFRKGFVDTRNVENGFIGSFDEDLEGDGSFASGPATVYWYTALGVED